MLKNLFTLILFTLFVGTGTSHALEFDRNFPDNIKKQILEDLQNIEKIQGSAASALHQKIYGQMDGKNYLDFFTKRIFKVKKSNCGSANAVACVSVFQPNLMQITENYIKFSHPSIARLMVIFHEARHSETQNGNWSHATCPTPFRDSQGNDYKSIWTGSSLAGQPACDVTPFGSYGSSTIMLQNISKNCANCTEKVRMDASIYAKDQLNRVINMDAKKTMIEDSFLAVKLKRR